MKLCPEHLCVGCGACVASCPKKAIVLETNQYGFLKRNIQEHLCVDCGMCEKSCPVLQADNIKQYDTHSIPLVYAAVSKDEQMTKSASGGVFYSLAKYTIEHKGVVFGAVFNECKSVQIVQSSTLEGLNPMQGSKYIKSATKDTYKEVKLLLECGKNVLYSGLPCQIAGLRSFLKKDYDNLITVEIVCHGGGSPRFFHDCMIEKEQEIGNKITNVYHRFKSKRWNPLIQITPAYCDVSEQMHISSWKKDPYLVAYLSFLILDTACFQCPFASIERFADVTIGDFCGLGSVKKTKLPVQRGVSQVILNNEKAKHFFNLIAENFFLEKRELAECMLFNHNLWKPTTGESKSIHFFENYEKTSLDTVRKKYLDRNLKRKIFFSIRDVLVCIFSPKLISRLMYYYYRYKKIDKQVDEILKIHFWEKK